MWAIKPILRILSTGTVLMMFAFGFPCAYQR
jgi:hypothetical protein